MEPNCFGIIKGEQPLVCNGDDRGQRPKQGCLLYTSDAADDMQCVDLGGRRIIKKNFFKQKTAYEISECLVGSEMCIRDSNCSDRPAPSAQSGRERGYRP